ncbi:MAG: hypothetical protein M0R74_01370 [Dehalococcoidia bacterium]|nr:hypothetical protein [Dehalococcoidia bacterium]
MSEASALLDALLEELTGALVGLTGERRTDGMVRVVTDAGWQLEAWVDEETFALDLVAASEAALDALDDYQLALVYGLGFVDEGDEDEAGPLFRLEFEYDPGEEWEEEALRELALLGLGLLRDVLRCPVAAYRVDSTQST